MLPRPDGLAVRLDWVRERTRAVLGRLCEWQLTGIGGSRNRKL